MKTLNQLKNITSSKHTKKTTTIAITLMLVALPLFLYLPIATADTPTYAFIAVSPNPTGANQQVTILMWLDKIEPTANGPAGGRWQNYTVLITKPDGNTQTLGPFKADDASFAYTLYNPDQIGTYTLKFSFPGQQVTGTGGGGILPIPIPINAYYGPSSFTTTLTVQQQQIVPSTQVPIPTGFWTRPINAQNQEWSKISGNWLALGGTSFGDTAYNGTGNFNPYTKAPDSAHIVWTKSLDFGGQIGGEFGGTTTSNYYTGKSYEPKFTPPIIINGVLYYNSPNPPKEGFYAVDLRTGQTLWWQNSTGPVTLINSAILGSYGYPGISCGQIFSFITPNEEGARPYLWYMAATVPSGTGLSAGQTSVQYYMYDANTGNLILTLSNATAGGTRVEGPAGELLIYFLGSSWVALWNSTKAIGTFAFGGYQSWAWRPPTGSNLNWRNGIQWNVTVPPNPGQTIAQINSGIILATTGNSFLPQNSQMEIGYDAATGNQLWVQNRTLPIGSTAYGLMSPLMNGIYAEFHKESMQWYGYSAYTGQQIWGPSEAYTNAWGSQPRGAIIAYGNLYATAVDGIHAFDLSTGKKLWEFYAADSGVNYPGFSTYPFLAGSTTVADSKVFAVTGNSHGDPLFRGSELYAIDANSGKQVWSISGFYLGTMPVADGYLVAFNGYDNRIYTFGKGQTATTVTATPGVGNAVTIQGTITDQSPGQTSIGVPAAGTPAISDDSMSAWMEYLYMQQPMPTGAKGVSVTVYVTDPSGSTTSLGKATSDITGHYALSWTPSTQGVYTITAAFDGSKSYFASTGETHIAVGSTPTSTTAPSNTVNAVSPEIFYAVSAVLAILMIAVAVLVLKKK